MRLFRKLLLVSIASAAALLAALALAAVTLIAKPHWFLTTRTVTIAVKNFGGSWHPRWKNMDFGIRSISFPEKEIRLRAGDLCFENAAAGAEGCLKSLDVRLSVRLHFFGAKLTRVSRLIVSGDHFNLDLSGLRPGAPPVKSAGLPTALPNLIPAALRGLALELVRVDLPANKIVSAGGSFKGGVGLNLGLEGDRPLALKVDVAHSSGSFTRHYSGEATLASDLLKGLGFTYLDARGQLKSEGVSARFQARVDEKGADALVFSLKADARMPGRRIEAGVEGSQKGQDFRLNGSAGVWETTGPVKSVRLRQFTLGARLKKNSTEWETLKLDSGFELEPETFGVRGAGRSMAKTLEGRLSVKARSTPGLLERDHFDADVSLTVNPVKFWYEFYGSFEGKVSGRASQLQALDISHKLDFGLKVDRFEDLVEYLAHTPYSVPAPINVFRGPLSVSLKGSGDSLNDIQDFDYALVSGLAAGRQALKFEVKGKVAASRLWTPERSFKNKTELALREVALQLPRFDLKGMATFAPDSRIKTGAELNKAAQAREEERKRPAEGTAAAVQSEIRVKTLSPAILYSNLAKDPVPVGLDFILKIPPGGMVGTVEIKPFRVEIFRRLASIDHIKFTGRAGSPVMGLDGLIVYKAAEAKIFIRLLGTAQKPQVKFESDPPMSQADITAMLLFGKSPGKLDSDQQASAANTQTAVSNSAFGLASLYLLASTPIDYVGYDPVSRTYTVKLRIPGGATLQLGSDGQSKGVQLRKRIASNLAIQTELTNTQTQGNVVTTLLEWYGRR
ncbi:MAG: translocation/assembly module TamB domain-containing protein [Elusimicrobiales bacterium]|nr:translocation/assembly module TamB domain-containing protein [Elusimicrobiales bacterium]